MRNLLRVSNLIDYCLVRSAINLIRRSIIKKLDLISYNKAKRGKIHNNWWNQRELKSKVSHFDETVHFLELARRLAGRRLVRWVKVKFSVKLTALPWVVKRERFTFHGFVEQHFLFHLSHVLEQSVVGGCHFFELMWIGLELFVDIFGVEGDFVAFNKLSEELFFVLG